MSVSLGYRARVGAWMGMAVVLAAGGAARASTTPAPNPPGAPYENHSYELVVDPSANWTEANSEATKLGGWLVTIDSVSEQEFVANLLLTSNAPPGAYWLGLVKSPTTGQFTWSSKPGKPVFTHWLPTQPDNLNGDESYGSILWSGPSADAIHRSYNGFWNDLPLNGFKAGGLDVFPAIVEHGYVVEFDSLVAPKAPPGVQTYVAGGSSSASIAEFRPAIAIATAAVAAPVPAAVWVAPLGLLAAGWAGRRMKHRLAREA